LLAGCGGGAGDPAGTGTAAELVKSVLDVPLLQRAASPASTSEVRINVLSNRADVVSAGDALVEITGPNLAELRVDVDGRDVTSAFAPRRHAAPVPEAGQKPRSVLGERHQVSMVPESISAMWCSSGRRCY
jgi:hypothetical protein